MFDIFFTDIIIKTEELKLVVNVMDPFSNSALIESPSEENLEKFKSKIAKQVKGKINFIKVDHETRAEINKH